jgi:hypothetical protein
VLENIKDLLDKLKEKEKLSLNPFASVPNHKLEEALNYLTEFSDEITPAREQE